MRLNEGMFFRKVREVVERGRAKDPGNFGTTELLFGQ